MFTQKHYRAIAKILTKLPNNQVKGEVVSDFINLFEAYNPCFSANHFSNACYETT